MLYLLEPALSWEHQGKYVGVLSGLLLASSTNMIWVVPSLS